MSDRANRTGRGSADKRGRVFDQYRRPYGQPVVAGQTQAWLTEQTSHRRLAIFAAQVGEDLAALATTVVVPASLRLATLGS